MLHIKAEIGRRGQIKASHVLDNGWSHSVEKVISRCIKKIQAWYTHACIFYILDYDAFLYLALLEERKTK